MPGVAAHASYGPPPIRDSDTTACVNVARTCCSAQSRYATLLRTHSLSWECRSDRRATASCPSVVLGLDTGRVVGCNRNQLPMARCAQQQESGSWVAVCEQHVQHRMCGCMVALGMAICLAVLYCVQSNMICMLRWTLLTADCTCHMQTRVLWSVMPLIVIVHCKHTPCPM